MALIFNRLKHTDWKSWLRMLIDVSCTWIAYLFLSRFFSFAFASIGPNLRFVTWPLTAILHAFYPRDMKRGSRVNCAFAIKVIYDDCIELKNEKTHPMLRRYASDTKKQYMKLVRKQMALCY